MKKVAVLMSILLLLVSCTSDSNNDSGVAYNFTVENTAGERVSLDQFSDQTVFVLTWTST